MRLNQTYLLPFVLFLLISCGKKGEEAPEGDHQPGGQAGQAGRGGAGVAQGGNHLQLQSGRQVAGAVPRPKGRAARRSRLFGHDGAASGSTKFSICMQEA